MTMMIREAILSELERQGRSRYWLAQRLEVQVPARTVYAYLAGQRDVGAEAAGHMLAALGLRVVPDDNKDRTKKT